MHPRHLFLENGFDDILGSGSHIKYGHPLFPGIVTLSPHGATVKGYQVKQAIAAIDVVRAAEEA